MLCLSLLQISEDGPVQTRDEFFVCDHTFSNWEVLDCNEVSTANNLFSLPF